MAAPGRFDSFVALAPPPDPRRAAPNTDSESVPPPASRSPMTFALTRLRATGSPPGTEPRNNPPASHRRPRSAERPSMEPAVEDPRALPLGANELQLTSAS